MKPEGAFFSGAILGIAGAYLYNKYSENCDDLKGGAKIKRDANPENIKKTVKDSDTKKAIDSPTAANISYVCKTYPN